MKKLVLLSVSFCALLIQNKQASAQTTAQSFSQPYTFAAGLKFGGYENGLSGKYFMDKGIALEGVLGFRDGGVVITGLYEINQVAFDVPELKFYYGVGAHLGSISQAYDRFGSNGSSISNTNNQLLLGVDGVVGLEYVFPQFPIAVSLDLNPRLELIGGPFVDIAPGVGIKYYFK